jgi:ZIP family zinc transporter
MGVAEGNVGLAIGLVCGAGAATAIGASAVFFPSIVKLASRRTLAASLGLSAGVMVYVSFVEIFAKAVDAFGPDNAGFTEDKAFNYATLTFFCGILLMKVSPPSPIYPSRRRLVSIISHPFFLFYC